MLDDINSGLNRPLDVKRFRVAGDFEYEGCTVDPLFITKENLAEAIAYLPNAAIKKKIKTPRQFLEKMRWDADFKRLYPDLE